jgi:hypothetical protein
MTVAPSQYLEIGPWWSGMTLQKIWTALPPIVRATLHAAWAASKVGAISMATFFTIVSLGYGAYGAATGHMHVLELLLVPVGGAALLVLSLLFSFLITVPVSFVVATCAYPFLRGLQGAGRKAFGIAGFLVGSLVWLGWRGAGANPGNLFFGSLISVFVIGGLAGSAGGLAFARDLPRRG